MPAWNATLAITETCLGKELCATKLLPNLDTNLGI